MANSASGVAQLDVLARKRRELEEAARQPGADIEQLRQQAAEIDKRMQPIRARVLAQKPTPTMQNMMTGMQQLTEPRKTVSGGPAVPKGPEPAGILSRVARRGMDVLQDPAAASRLAMALNTMRMQPDQGLARALGDRATSIEQRRQQAVMNQQDADATIELLQQRGLLTGYTAKQIESLRRSPRLLMAVAAEALKAPRAPSVFEQKISALVSTGVPRAEAIRQVIEGEAAGTQINMPDPARSAIFKETYQSDEALRKGAQAAVETITKTNETLSLLQQGQLNLGLANPALQFKDRLLTMFGNEEAAQRASDTQLLNSMLGTDVFGAISALGIGARGLDTPAEREFLREVLTGTTAMDAPAIEKMAKLRAKYAQRALNRYNDAVEKGQFIYIEQALNVPTGTRFGKIEAPKLGDATPVERPEGYPEEDWNLVPISQRQQVRDEFLRRG